MKLDKSFCTRPIATLPNWTTGNSKKEFMTQRAQRRAKTKHECDTQRTTHKIHGVELRRRERRRIRVNGSVGGGDARRWMDFLCCAWQCGRNVRAAIWSWFFYPLRSIAFWYCKMRACSDKRTKTLKFMMTSPLCGPRVCDRLYGISNKRDTRSEVQRRHSMNASMQQKGEKKIAFAQHKHILFMIILPLLFPHFSFLVEWTEKLRVSNTNEYRSLLRLRFFFV